MFRHPSTESWLISSSRALAANGVLGIVRRRSLQLLLSSSLRGETRHDEVDLAPESANARAVLLDAWAAAESVRRTHESGVSAR